MSDPLFFSPEQAIHFIKTIHEPGAVFEVRALGVPGSARVFNGYFTSPEAAVEAIAEEKLGRAAGLYVTLNAVDPAVYARRRDRIAPVNRDEATSDGNVIRLRWLMLDIDPQRVSQVSSSEAEHEAALLLASDITSSLSLSGWTAPVTVDSGNGVHLLWPVELATKDAYLLKACLSALDFLFSRPDVHVDLATANPARLARLAGSMNRKGDDTVERPHRMATITQLMPDAREQLVTRLQLEELGARTPSVEPVGRNKNRGAFDLDAWLSEHVRADLQLVLEPLWRPPAAIVAIRRMRPLKIGL